MASSGQDETTSAASMMVFIHDYLKKCQDLSSITIREMREKYTQNNNLKSLNSECKETFRTLVDLALVDFREQKNEVTDVESDNKENQKEELNKSDPEAKSTEVKKKNLEDNSSELNEVHSCDDEATSDTLDSFDIIQKPNKFKCQPLISDDSENDAEASDDETVKLSSQSEDETMTSLQMSEDETEGNSLDRDDKSQLLDSGNDTDENDQVLQESKNCSSLSKNQLVESSSGYFDNSSESDALTDRKKKEKTSTNQLLSESEDHSDSASDSKESHAISKIRKAVVDDELQITKENDSENVSLSVKSFYKRKKLSIKNLSDLSEDETVKRSIRKIKTKTAKENYNSSTNDSIKKRKSSFKKTNKKRKLSLSDSDDEKILQNSESSSKLNIINNCKDKKTLNKRKKKGSDSEVTSDEEDVPLAKFCSPSGKPTKREVESDFSDSDNKPLKELSLSNEKKNNRKKKSKQESSSVEEKNNQKIEKLKRCIRTAGLRIVYVKLFEDCRNSKEKVNKLIEILEDAGITGVPTLEKCKKLRAKRETAKEVNELDRSNIINSEGRSCRSRNVPEQKHDSEMTELSKPKFSRLKDIVDSEESD